MKRNLKGWYVVVVAVSIALGLMASSVSPVWAGAAIIPPQAKGGYAYCMTYAEWSAAWWQWALSLSADENPWYDVDGSCVNGAFGQREPVWFLTGVHNVSGTAVRNCTVPAGKTLFFPIINAECSTLETPPFNCSNEANCLSCAMSFTIGDVFATIDGVAVKNLDRYLVQSPLFTFTLPNNNVWGMPAGSTGQSVSSGYYLMLSPLSPGVHVIHFGGTYTDYNFSLNITYNLTVAPGS
jgi:hypothetical protein